MCLWHKYTLLTRAVAGRVGRGCAAVWFTTASPRAIYHNKTPFNTHLRAPPAFLRLPTICCLPALPAAACRCAANSLYRALLRTVCCTALPYRIFRGPSASHSPACVLGPFVWFWISQHIYIRMPTLCHNIRCVALRTNRCATRTTAYRLPLPHTMHMIVTPPTSLMPLPPAYRVQARLHTLG